MVKWEWGDIMSYIPDVRTALVKDALGSLTRERNGYYENLLSKGDRRNVDAYDFCVGNVENFFCNLDEYEDVLKPLGFDPMKVDMDTIIKDKCIQDYSDAEKADMSWETKLTLAFGTSLLEWLEIMRNEWVVSMIDSMPDDKYCKRFKKVWGDLGHMEG